MLTHTTTSPPRAITVNQIIMATCGAIEVDFGDFCGHGRSPQTVLARGVAAYLSRAMTDDSLPEIARAMGRPSHSGLIYAVRRVEQLIAGGDTWVTLCAGTFPLVMVLSELRASLIAGRPFTLKGAA